MQLDLFSTKDIKTINDAFLQCSSWADSPNHEKPLKPSKAAKQYAHGLITGFLRAHGETARGFIDQFGLAQFGHSLYLSVLGHGAGFCDFSGDDSKALNDIVQKARDTINRPDYTGYVDINTKSLFTEFIANKKSFDLSGYGDTYGLKRAVIHFYSLDKSGQKTCFHAVQTVARYNPLEWQKQGLTYTKTGYGKKIPTVWQYKNPNTGRWNRVYCSIYSNNARNYVLIDGRDFTINIDE